jgi:hypothetical protein
MAGKLPQAQATSNCCSPKSALSKQALWPSKFLPGAHISESELQVSSLQAQQVSARRTMTREIMSLSRNLVSLAAKCWQHLSVTN